MLRMNIIIRLRRIAALSLAFATVPVHAMGNQAEPLPLKLVLTNECGTAKNEALETFKGRPLSWCPFDGTKLTAGTNDAAALAGRRLYVSMDLEPARQSKLPIGLILSTFNGTWQVKTHIGAFFQVTEGRIEASVYVPDDAETSIGYYQAAPLKRRPLTWSSATHKPLSARRDSAQVRCAPPAVNTWMRSWNGYAANSCLPTAYN